MYLSIDVGIKNLAYIVYDGTKIVDWKVVEICDSKMNANHMNMVDLGKGLFKALETITDKIDLILIENQIGQNAIRMKALQGMITLYFISKGKYDIQYWNAGNKLKRFLKAKEKTTYTQRKKIGIKLTNFLLEEHFPEQIEYFKTHKKKDDLADCFLQLFDYLGKNEKVKDEFFMKTINLYNAIDLKL
jgi:hypothetical protein